MTQDEESGRLREDSFGSLSTRSSRLVSSLFTSSHIPFPSFGTGHVSDKGTSDVAGS